MRPAFHTSVGYEIFGKGIQVPGEMVEFHETVIVEIGNDDILRITCNVDHLNI